MRPALFLYNLLQVLAVIVATPVLFVKIILTPKYRGRIPRRLGLADLPASLPAGRPRIWIHALSVGEVSSARSLVSQLRRAHPGATLIFSASTQSGERFAERTLRNEVDGLVAFPLDLRWSVNRFLNRLDPDLFILVETDFWPNFLAALAQRSIPAVLVNGRISQASLRRYHRLRFLFAPLFRSFSRLLMQTGADAENMVRLGVEAERVAAVGNLKYDAGLSGPAVRPPGRNDWQIPVGAPVWVAGSTHQGEEEIVLAVYRRLLADFPELLLIVAPRQPDRGGEVAAEAARLGMAVLRRSSGARWPRERGEVLVLDTLGELADVYGMAAIALVGGSLVPEGGHNPLEPAALGKPVLFGPHMEDFVEISRDLVAAGGALEIQGAEDLYRQVKAWLREPEQREAAGRQAGKWVRQQQGATERHLEVIGRILTARPRRREGVHG